MKLKLIDRPLTHLTLVLVLGFLAFSNTLDAPFQFDDRIVLNSSRFKDISNVPSMFVELTGPWASRPLLHATMAVNYYLGGLKTTGYHVFNLAVHLLNGMLLYFLVMITGRHTGRKEEDLRQVAFLSSAVFVLHPLQTEAVTYIVSRSTLMSTSFYFAGLILFSKAATSSTRRWPYAAGLFVVSLLGMASRENFAPFPLVLLLYDLFFISGFRLREAASRYRIYIPVLLSLGYFAFLALNNTYTPRSDAPGAGMLPAQYVLTGVRAHWTYLRLLVLPINQNMDYDYPVASHLPEPTTLLAFVGYLGLWAAGIGLARKRPVSSFALLWFLITLVPISFAVTVLRLNLDDVIFEHRLYLPGAAIIVALSAGAVWAVAGLKRAPRALSFALAAVLVATLACATYSRNDVWKSPVRLWEDVVDKSPGKARGYNNLADAYVSRGEPERAVALLKKALTAEPYDTEVHVHHYGLARAYEDIGLADKAIEQYQFALNIKPEFAEAHNGMALVYVSRGDYGRAEEHFMAAVRIKPDYVDALNNLGALYVTVGKPDEAISYLLRALTLDPDNARPYSNLGGAYAAKGELEKAIEYYRTALRLNPDSEDARKNLNAAYLQYQERHGVSR